MKFAAILPLFCLSSAIPASWALAEHPSFPNSARGVDNVPVTASVTFPSLISHLGPSNATQIWPLDQEPPKVGSKLQIRCYQTDMSAIPPARWGQTVAVESVWYPFTGLAWDADEPQQCKRSRTDTAPAATDTVSG